jgi:hypothetical protein
MGKHQHKQHHATYLWEAKAAPERKKKQQNPPKNKNQHN